MNIDKLNPTKESSLARVIPLICLLALSQASQAASHERTWSLTKAVKTAQKNDPWLTGNKHQQQAVEALSHAAASMPDPKMSIGLANLPTDGFNFSQEGMTQFKVGITQMFPRGDTLAIKNQQLRIESEAYPFQRADRKAKVAVTVGSLWLDAYRVQQSIALIEKNRSLFEQLADVAQASYSSALGKTRQQDIVRAQLELTRLDDRLDILAQQQNAYLGMLSKWLSTAFMTQKNTNANAKQGITWAQSQLHTMPLAKELPELDLLNSKLVLNKSWQSAETLVTYLAQHPSVLALEKKISATKTTINLAEQQYQPEWGVNASYGYRDDEPMGNSRADLFSVGVTFDLPLFTENRQDMAVKSAISKTEAVKIEKILLLRQLLGSYSSAKGRLLRLEERKSLYKTRLLPQVQDQAEASLTAYTNDDGDFSEVVRSRIAVLNAQIDDLVIQVAEQKIILELNYLFVGSLSTTNSLAREK